MPTILPFGAANPGPIRVGIVRIAVYAAHLDVGRADAGQTSGLPWAEAAVTPWRAQPNCGAAWIARKTAKKPPRIVRAYAASFQPSIRLRPILPATPRPCGRWSTSCAASSSGRRRRRRGLARPAYLARQDAGAPARRPPDRSRNRVSRIVAARRQRALWRRRAFGQHHHRGRAGSRAGNAWWLPMTPPSRAAPIIR